MIIQQSPQSKTQGDLLKREYNSSKDLWWRSQKAAAPLTSIYNSIQWNTSNNQSHVTVNDLLIIILNSSGWWLQISCSNDGHEGCHFHLCLPKTSNGNTPPLCQTLEVMTEMSKKKGMQHKFTNSCDNDPPLWVKLDHVVMDELHLLLRITDVLIKNLVKEAVESDKKDNFNKWKADQKDSHIKKNSAPP